MVKILKNIFLCSLCILFIHQSEAQVISLGIGSFTGSNVIGPAFTGNTAGASSRYAYIFPESLMKNLRHGDSIKSLSFHRNAGASISGSSNLRIYIRTTVNSAYGNRSINWVNLTGATGMTKVYDKDPGADIGSRNGWVRFSFSKAYVVDTILGRNFEVLVEYSQTTAQAGSIFWSYENSGSVPGYMANQTKFIRVNTGTIPDTTNSSTELHPSIRIEFPRTDFDLSVSKMYSLGKLPVPLGNPDTVRAIISNVGKKAAVNFKVYLKSKGANKLVDSALYSLGYLEEKLLNMPLIYPTATGLDTLTVQIVNDDDISRNSVSITRLATENIYSYKDPATPIAGGVGFNGSSGDFVAKFYSNTQKSINQISVNFSGSGQKFKLGIWKTDGKGGTPGTLVWTSDTLISSPKFITPVLPAVAVNGSFFVGVRQLGTTNVAFGYQPDEPVRPGTFYFAAPMGDTNWVDFAPDAPYKFVIEPRLQAKNDVSPVSLDDPKDTVRLTNVKTMAPKVSVLNYGSNDQLTPFTVKITITRNNQLEYTSTRQDTLRSGRKHRITFDSTFLPKNAGEYVVTIVTLLPNDELKDNDTLKTRIIVAAFKDVGPGTIFDPGNGVDYEQNIDTIYPTVFIQNYGLDMQGPFNVTAQIYDDKNNLIYNETSAYTLTALNSVLASFKAFPCSKRGVYRFVAFTSLGVDVNRKNDTARRTFKVIRSNDVGITNVVYPENNKSLPFPAPARQPNLTVENAGDANQPSNFPVYADIYFHDSLIYRDSFFTNSFRTIPSNVLFKSFKPVQKGYYKLIAYTGLIGDQDRSNDTFVSTFAVGVPDDVELVAFQPVDVASLQVNRAYATRVTVKNNGYNPQNSPFDVFFKVNIGTRNVYTGQAAITLDSGETKTFLIDSALYLPEDTTYTVEVFTALPADFIKSNDTLKGVYTASRVYDVGVTAIYFPTMSDTLLLNTQNVQPRIRVSNLGDSLVKERFRATVQVQLLVGGQNIIYNKSIDTSLGGASSVDLMFPAFMLSGGPQDIRIIAFTDYQNDQYRANDTSRSTSRFMFIHNIMVDRVEPEDGKVYKTTEAPLLPQVNVINIGLRNENVLGRMVIKRVDTLTLVETAVYSDSVLATGLLPGETRTLVYKRSFVFADQVPGVFKAYVYNGLLGAEPDQMPGNNDAVIRFRITKPTGVDDVQVSRIVLYPNPSDGYFYLDTEFNGPQRIAISDVQGKIVYSADIAGSHEAVDVRHLVSGTYFVKIGFQVIKIIVRH
jgi:hypothetical protein